MVYFIFGVVSTIIIVLIGLLICASRKITILIGTIAQLSHYLESNYFTQGLFELEENEIAQAYRNVMVFFNIEDGNYGEIYDISKYESNNLIMISMAAPNANDIKCLLPNCDVFRTKDGYWYWRESEEEPV